MRLRAPLSREPKTSRRMIVHAGPRHTRVPPHVSGACDFDLRNGPNEASVETLRDSALARASKIGCWIRCRSRPNWSFTSVSRSDPVVADWSLAAASSRVRKACSSSATAGSVELMAASAGSWSRGRIFESEIMRDVYHGQGRTATEGVAPVVHLASPVKCACANQTLPTGDHFFQVVRKTVARDGLVIHVKRQSHWKAEWIKRNA